MSHNLNIAIIPDTHFPYVDQVKLDIAIKKINQIKPDVVVQIGDLYDQLSFSKYPRDPSKAIYNPREQAQRGCQMAFDMWSRLKSFQRIQIPGNHDERVIKQMTTRFPDAAFIAQDFFKDQMTFTGVKLVKDCYEIDDIMFMHGFRKAGEHAKWNQMSTVTGHTHKARIQYFQNRYGQFFQMNCGWLGDLGSYPFSYKAQKKITNTHTGFGLVEKGQPRFISI